MEDLIMPNTVLRAVAKFATPADVANFATSAVNRFTTETSAADTGLPNLNRRSALAKLGLGLAASTSLAASAIAAPDASVSPELLRLIDAHKAAYDADKEAERRREEAQEAYIAVRPATQIPLYDMRAKADRKRDQLLDMSLGLDECRKHFIESFEFRNQIWGIGEDYASPKRRKKLNAVLEAMKNDGLETIESAFAQDDAVRQSSGLAAAETDCTRAYAAEGEAMLALCAYRCATLAETRLKGGYLASDHLGYEALTPEHIEALLQSSRVEA
jgi:hypothetical protein